MKIVISIENLTKEYKSINIFNRKTKVAFEKLNLEIIEGEVFGLLGLNGAGKTTLIKILLGLIFPTKGIAWILGKKAGSEQVLSKISFLPEMPYFSRYATPAEILTYYGKLFSLENSVIAKKVQEALTLVGLIEHKNTRLAEFSKGMLQRVGMAQLFINDPELIFLDEPTFGLDPLACKEMRDIIFELKSRGKTIFLSSHQISEVEKLCDRIGILHNKKIVKTVPTPVPLENFFVSVVSEKL